LIYAKIEPSLEKTLNENYYLRKKLVQPVTDLGEARISAGFVLVAAGRPADADAADRVVARLDGHATERRHHLGIIERGIERAWRGDLLGEVRGRHSPQR